MKSRNTLLILLLSALCLSRLATAHGATMEDRAEFLKPMTAEESVTETNYSNADLDPTLKGSGEWTYQFELITPSGTKYLLDAKNTSTVFMPASTFKIFTSWWSFNKQSRSNDYLSKMLHESDNKMANATYLALGGAPAMKQYYLSLGLPINDQNFIPTDGAGLNHTTRTTVDIEMDLLEQILADPQYQTYRNLLAQPTEDGTLQDRLLEYHGRLFAKTGTLDYAVALAGFLDTPKGTLVFSIISKNLKIGLDDARAKIDAILRSYDQEISTLQLP